MDTGKFCSSQLCTISIVAYGVYSVTLSYNLFLEEETDPSMLSVDAKQDCNVEWIVNALKLPGNFDDSQPFIAFHLQHRYVSPHTPMHA